MPKLKSSLREWPTDFLLTPDLRQYALDRTINPDEEWEAFKDYHLAHGSRFADWAASWRTWCRNAVRFNPASHNVRAEFDRRIGFTAPKAQPEAVRAALRENEEAARETASMTDDQRRAAIRKLSEIYRSLK